MGYWFACPRCYKILDLNDFGNSLPTAITKLVDGSFCGNCGCDLTSPLQEAMRYLIAQRKQNERNELSEE